MWAVGAYYKRDSPYLCELAGPVLSHVLLVLLPAVSSYGSTKSS